MCLWHLSEYLNSCPEKRFLFEQEDGTDCKLYLLRVHYDIMTTLCNDHDKG